MTSPRNPTDTRITRSRRVLQGWKHYPPADVEEALRMIGEEIVELHKLQAKDPSCREKVDTLIEGWKVFQGEMKARAD